MLINTEQAAKKLGVSVNCLAVWRMKGKGPPYRQLVPGGTVRYDEEKLDEYLQQCEIDPRQQSQNTLTPAS